MCRLTYVVQCIALQARSTKINPTLQTHMPRTQGCLTNGLLEAIAGPFEAAAGPEGAGYFPNTSLELVHPQTSNFRRNLQLKLLPSTTEEENMLS